MYAILSDETPFIFLTDEIPADAECVWTGAQIERSAICMQSSSYRGTGDVWLSLRSVEALCSALESFQRGTQLKRQNNQSIIEYRSPEHDEIMCCSCGETTQGSDVVRFDQNYSHMSVGEGHVCCHVDCIPQLVATLRNSFNYADKLLGKSL